MYSKSELNDVLELFNQNVEYNCDLISKYTDLYSFFKLGDAVEVGNAVKNILNKLLASVPEGFEQKINLYKTINGGETLNGIGITLSINRKGKVVRLKNYFSVNKNIQNEIIDWLTAVIRELIINDCMDVNIEVLNAKFAEITKEAKVPYAIEFCDTYEADGKRIVSITDEKVVFAVDPEKIFTIYNLLLLAESDGELVTEKQIKGVFDSEVTSIMKAATTPELVALKDPVIMHVTGIPKTVKPLSLIKKVYTKDIAKARKEGVAKFMNDELFTAYSYDEEEIVNVLKPFDVKTFKPLEVDAMEFVPEEVLKEHSPSNGVVA